MGKSESDNVADLKEVLFDKYSFITSIDGHVDINKVCSFLESIHGFQSEPVIEYYFKKKPSETGNVIRKLCKELDIIADALEDIMKDGGISRLRKAIEHFKRYVESTKKIDYSGKKEKCAIANVLIELGFFNSGVLERLQEVKNSAEEKIVRHSDDIVELKKALKPPKLEAPKDVDLFLETLSEKEIIKKYIKKVKSKTKNVLKDILGCMEIKKKYNDGFHVDSGILQNRITLITQKKLPCLKNIKKNEKVSILDSKIMDQLKVTEELLKKYNNSLNQEADVSSPV